MKNKLFIVATFLLTLTFIVSACTPGTTASAPDTTSNSASVENASPDGKALTETRCTQCHGLDKITSQAKSMESWTATVDRMIGKGAKLNDAEKTAVINYLAETYK